eukprot:7514291-Pyramimonas_sp.AAC.1
MQLGDELASPPEDGIASLQFAPSTSSSDLLVTSWDRVCIENPDEFPVTALDIHVNRGYLAYLL